MGYYYNAERLHSAIGYILAGETDAGSAGEHPARFCYYIAGGDGSEIDPEGGEGSVEPRAPISHHLLATPSGHSERSEAKARNLAV